MCHEVFLVKRQNSTPNKHSPCLREFTVSWIWYWQAYHSLMIMVMRIWQPLGAPRGTLGIPQSNNSPLSGKLDIPLYEEHMERGCGSCTKLPDLIRLQITNRGTPSLAWEKKTKDTFSGWLLFLWALSPSFLSLNSLARNNHPLLLLPTEFCWYLSGEIYLY